MLRCIASVCVCELALFRMCLPAGDVALQIVNRTCQLPWLIQPISQQHIVFVTSNTHTALPVNVTDGYAINLEHI